MIYCIYKSDNINFYLCKCLNTDFLVLKKEILSIDDFYLFVYIFKLYEIRIILRLGSLTSVRATTSAI